MARDDPYVSTVKEELRHYPGAAIDIQNGGKHRKAAISFGDKTATLTLPKTGSDWRGPQNAKRDLRKTLRELGVPRVEPERKQPVAATFAVSSQGLVVHIPPTSPIIDKFMTPDHKPVGWWTLELRASADLKAPPMLAVKRTTIPPGRVRENGKTQGYLDARLGGWTLNLSKSALPALKVEKLRAVHIHLWHDDGEAITLKLPNGCIPTSYAPHDEGEAPLPSKAWPEKAAEDPQEAESKPAAPQVAKPDLSSILERPIVLKMPTPKLSVEQAVAFLNQRKLALGNKLRFTVTEGGNLSVVHRID